MTGEHLTADAQKDELIRISDSTFFMKRVFTTVWFGLSVTGALYGINQPEPDLLLVVGSGILALFGYFMFRKSVWPLADEAYDGGDFLLIRKGEDEFRIPFEEIVEFHRSELSEPRSVDVSFNSDASPIRKITFYEITARNPFKTPEVLLDVEERIARARQEPRSEI